MLTLYDFNGLDDNGKAKAVWAGTFLADRFTAEYTVQLYSVGNFYVELFYNAAENKIDHFKAFTTKSLLAPYLAQIKFSL